MDPLVKLGRGPRARAGRSPRAGKSARTARPSRSTSATTASGRTATPSRPRTSSGRGSGRSRPSSAPTTRTSSSASTAPPTTTRARRTATRCADKVGVNAVDDRTLEVKLTTAQPWFIQQAAHHSFLAVHRPTVEQYGEKWTEAANIVTNGPFKLHRWEHNSAHRPRQVERVARRGRRQARRASTAA